MPSLDTREQIRDLRLEAGRPVVICDVDEVVVHFIRGLESYLDRNGLWLHAQSFALNGNIKRKADNAPITVEDLRNHLEKFFEEEVERLDVIEGAATALNTLSETANIVMLTNLPVKYREPRIANLAAHGLKFPVVTNDGPKGPAVKALLERHDSPAVFIDDIPSYLLSVHEHCRDVHLLHFVQDKRFGALVETPDPVGLRTDRWDTAQRHILASIGG